MRRRCLGCKTLIDSGSRCESCKIDHRRSVDADRAEHEPWRRIYNTAAWTRAKSAAKVRAGFKCEWGGCPRKDQLNVHHKKPLADGGDPFDLSNLQVLCPDHHPEAEPERQMTL